MSEHQKHDFPPDALRAAADLFEQRNKVYGDTWKRFGVPMIGLFPNGVALRTEEDFNRFVTLVNIMTKLARYAENFHRGGHLDSARDLQVYAAILEAKTRETD